MNAIYYNIRALSSLKVALMCRTLKALIVEFSIQWKFFLRSAALRQQEIRKIKENNKVKLTIKRQKEISWTRFKFHDTVPKLSKRLSKNFEIFAIWEFAPEVAALTLRNDYVDIAPLGIVDVPMWLTIRALPVSTLALLCQWDSLPSSFGMWLVDQSWTG